MTYSIKHGVCEPLVERATRLAGWLGLWVFVVLSFVYLIIIMGV